MIGKDVRTVHRLADSGALPSAMKLPGRTGALLFDREVVDRYLQDNQVPAVSST